MRRALGVLLIAAVAVAIPSVVLRRYDVREMHQAELFWSSREAYVFVNRIRLEWQRSYLESWIQLARIYVYQAVPANDRRRSLTVVWFTKDAVEQRTIDGVDYGRYLVVDGQIFKNSQLKWSGTRQVPTTAEEQQRYQATATPLPPRYFENLDGWSNKDLVIARPGETRHGIQMNGETMHVVVNHDPATEQITIRLERGGGATELVALDRWPRRVSGADYRRDFN